MSEKQAGARQQKGFWQRIARVLEDLDRTFMSSGEWQEMRLDRIERELRDLRRRMDDGAAAKPEPPAVEER